MNWLDLVFIAILAMGSYIGLRTGLIQTAFLAVGVLVGILLAGHISGDLSAWLTDHLFVGNLPVPIAQAATKESVVTVVSYFLIILMAVIVAVVIAVIVRRIATILLLGFVDRLGGVAMGLAAGAALSAAAIIGMAHLTYNAEIADEGLAASIVANFPQVPGAKQHLGKALTESALVPVFIDLAGSLPADALGLVPSDFRGALDVLEQSIKGPIVEASS